MIPDDVVYHTFQVGHKEDFDHAQSVTTSRPKDAIDVGQRVSLHSRRHDSSHDAWWQTW